MCSHQDFDTVVLRKTDKKSVINNYQVSSEKKVEQKADEGSYRPEKYSTEFIQKIKNFRKTKELNQQQFAQAMGISQASIRDVEANTSVYNSALVQKINNYISRASK
jgi:ribosome-binding protein aMBF1 (putative translation factor)